ncbi:helix-turn-helix domain-containing protein [Olleya sp. AH-315-F22]|nr:helix-turn-helix domain-containing protein [Olleya sp. AH-315-F22]
MKILPFKIPKPNDDALVYQEDREWVFYDKFHQHEEIQISFIKEGEGTLVVGDTVNHYKKGDILVIGSNLPHVFKSEVIANKKSLMLSLFFTKNSFGKHFFNLEELSQSRLFFKRAENGFKAVSHKQKLQYYFLQLKESMKFNRFILLLKILDLLSKSRYKSLSSFVYEKQYSDTEGKRMSAVMDYTMNNFQNNVSLEDISKVSAMTKNAFCKYFKKRTNKTYFQFLNELRIENASKLLLANNDLCIPEIADKSGFNNISNFNRQFKSIKLITPSEYKK